MDSTAKGKDEGSLSLKEWYLFLNTGMKKKIGWLESEGGWLVFQCIKNFQFWMLFSLPGFLNSFQVDKWRVSLT